MGFTAGLMNVLLVGIAGEFDLNVILLKESVLKMEGFMFEKYNLPISI